MVSYHITLMQRGYRRTLQPHGFDFRMCPLLSSLQLWFLPISGVKNGKGAKPAVIAKLFLGIRKKFPWALMVPKLSPGSQLPANGVPADLVGKVTTIPGSAPIWKITLEISSRNKAVILMWLLWTSMDQLNFASFKLNQPANFSRQMFQAESRPNYLDHTRRWENPFHPKTPRGHGFWRGRHADGLVAAVPIFWSILNNFDKLRKR